MTPVVVESRCQQCREPIVKRDRYAPDLCDKHLAAFIDDLAALTYAVVTKDTK